MVSESRELESDIAETIPKETTLPTSPNCKCQAEPHKKFDKETVETTRKERTELENAIHNFIYVRYECLFYKILIYLVMNLYQSYGFF